MRAYRDENGKMHVEALGVGCASVADVYSLLKRQPEVESTTADWLGKASVLLAASGLSSFGEVTPDGIRRELDRYYLGSSVSAQSFRAGQREALDCVRGCLTENTDFVGRLLELLG